MISWDPGVISFVSIAGGTSPGFGNVNSNVLNAANGSIAVNQFYVHPPGTPATGGLVNVAKITFSTTGADNDTTSVNVGVTALLASDTFHDLKPGHEVQPDLITVASTSVTVSSPNGGESWVANTVHDISWTATNMAAVRLEYTTDGLNWTPVANPVNAADGSYAWTVPDISSTAVTVRISDNDSPASDASDNTFTVMENGLWGDVDDSEDVAITDALVIATYMVYQPNPESNPALIPFLASIAQRGDVSMSQSVDIADALICATYDIDPGNASLGARIGNQLSLVSKSVAHRTFPVSSAISPDIIITPEEKSIQATVLLRSLHRERMIGAARVTVRWDCGQYIFRGVREDGNTVTALNEEDASRGVIVMAGIVAQGCPEMVFPHIILEPKSEKDTGSITVEVTEAVEAVTFMTYTGRMSYSRQLSSSSEQPASLVLLQNAPNPFNPVTVIPYSIPKTMRISLAIYSSHGQKIRTLAEGETQPGHYQAVWNGEDDTGAPVASGIYFYTLATEHSRLTKRLTLLR
ncbi:MAG: FlgD immunoglobulin-like domain containing protein [Candidatus Latescibacterota bacterium]